MAQQDILHQLCPHKHLLFYACSASTYSISIAMCHPTTYMYKLDTEQLYLEPVSGTDLPVLHAILTDESVRKYLCDSQIIPVSQSAHILETVLDTFAGKGYGLWLVYLKASLELIGIAGLYSFFSEPQPQLLYALLLPYQKKGYATEASHRIIRYAFEKLGYTYLLASCDVPNVPSVRVMERLGMQWLKEECVEGKSLVFYQLTS
jgi:[ribosomal protein S5]-alanine N-acetyltransferase